MSTRRVAYIDAFSGVAGDMLLAALIDNGLDVESIKSALKTLTTIEHEWDITVSSVVRSEGMIGAKHVNVKSIYNHEPALVPGAITGNSNNNNSSSKKRQVKFAPVPIVYPFFGEHLPPTSKVIALKCLDYLQGKDIYAMSQVNTLWSRAAMDDALWE